jgi:acetoin utilization deacetylase AcuC-like enzyme
MKVFYCDHFVLPLPPGHRFPMQKYALLRQRVIAANQGQFELQVPAAASDDAILLAHEAAYLQRVVNGTLSARELRVLGFPWSPSLVERSRRSSGATIAACRAALEDGVAASLAGGTHHAFANRAQGFCIFNDSAIAARVMQREGQVKQVIVIDCDVHQGNGTAAILADDPSIFTFSLHGQKNFPFRKECSDLDIELPDGSGDAAYLEALEQGLRTALPRAQAELAIYLAGADPFEGDRLGRLAVSKTGLAERDRLVFEHCAHQGMAVAVTMAGGYAWNVEEVVDIHFQTIIQAAGVTVHPGRWMEA